MEGWRIRLRKRRQGREMGEKGLKVVRKEVIVRTGTDILVVVVVGWVFGVDEVCNLRVSVHCSLWIFQMLISLCERIASIFVLPECCRN